MVAAIFCSRVGRVPGRVMYPNAVACSSPAIGFLRPIIPPKSSAVRIAVLLPTNWFGKLPRNAPRINTAAPKAEKKSVERNRNAVACGSTQNTKPVNLPRNRCAWAIQIDAKKKISKRNRCRRPGCFVSFELDPRVPHAKYCSSHCYNDLRAAVTRVRRWFDSLGIPGSIGPHNAMRILLARPGSCEAHRAWRSTPIRC